MSADNAFVEEVIDRLQVVGPATARKMFGGFGIFLDGRMFALIADNELFLKADKQNLEHFEEAGLQPFTYSKSGKTFNMSYYQAPESFFEDDEIVILWSNRAIEAALRVPKKDK